MGFRISLPGQKHNIGEAPEQYGFAFHHGFSRQRSNISRAQYGRAAGHSGGQVLSHRVVEGQFWLPLNL
jgi:hypothetical protein